MIGRNAFLTKVYVILSALVSLGAAEALAVEQEPLYGRISALEGSLAVRGPEEEEWSWSELNGIVGDQDALLTDRESLGEMEMPERVFIRLGESTTLDVVSVREGRYRLRKGSAYFSLGDVPDRAVAVETPACGLLLTGQALARVDIGEDGGVRVCSLGGDVEVLGAAESVAALQPAMTLGVSPEGSFVALGAMTDVLADRLAQWHARREVHLAGHVLPQSVPTEAVGAHELSASGDWVTEAEIVYWKPRVEPAWRPYSAGVWRYWRPVGWCWVPRRSFEYVTCHYGYWHFSRRHGWLWRPSWRWRPARVCWAADAGGVSWAPIDIHRRPICVGDGGSLSISFAIGDNASISFGWWNYASLSDFRSCVPPYKVVKRRAVRRGGVLHVDGVVVVRSIDKVATLRPTVLVRGRRRGPDFHHGLLAAAPRQERDSRGSDRYRGHLDSRLERFRASRAHASRRNTHGERDGSDIARRTDDLRARTERRDNSQERGNASKGPEASTRERAREGDSAKPQQGKEGSPLSRPHRPERATVAKRLHEVRVRQERKRESLEDIHSRVRTRLEEMKAAPRTPYSRAERGRSVERPTQNKPSSKAVDLLRERPLRSRRAADTASGRPARIRSDSMERPRATREQSRVRISGPRERLAESQRSRPERRPPQTEHRSAARRLDAQLRGRRSPEGRGKTTREQQQRLIRRTERPRREASAKAPQAEEERDTRRK